MPQTDLPLICAQLNYFVSYSCPAYQQVACPSLVNGVCYCSPVERLGSVYILLPGSGMPVNTTPESRAAALKSLTVDEIQGT